MFLDSYSSDRNLPRRHFTKSSRAVQQLQPTSHRSVRLMHVAIMTCRVLNLTVFLSGAKNTSTSLISAGATAPEASLETGANQCSFSTENYRAIKRGGAYVATVADLPQPSLYVSSSASWISLLQRLCCVHCWAWKSQNLQASLYRPEGVMLPAAFNLLDMTFKLWQVQFPQLCL